MKSDSKTTGDETVTGMQDDVRNTGEGRREEEKLGEEDKTCQGRLD